MATAYLAPTRISKHLSRTPDGFLLCKDAPITRSGWFTYRREELNLPGSGNVEVLRPVEEITSQRFLASLEGAPVTDHHPPRFIDGQNYRYHSAGHAQNARVSPEKDEDGNVQVIADLFINDGDLADRVEAGVIRDLSPGFDYELKEDSKGRLCQTALRANHLAVVPAGRSGTSQIVDAAPLASFGEMADRYLGNNIAEVEETMKCKDADGPVESGWEAGKSLAHIGEDEPDEELIPVEEKTREADPPDLRAQALDYLRKIKPAVMRGSDQVKRHWNSLWTAIKGGEEPRAALDRIRGKRQAADGMSAEDARQGLADDFTATCAAYLGQDIGEVSEQREELRRQRPAFDSWPDQRRAVAEDLMARAERMGRQMRRAKY